MDGLRILDPTLGPATGRASLSPRLDSLTGKTLGVIWNGRPGGDLILEPIVEALREKHDIKAVVFRQKPTIGNIAPEAILEEMAANCDAVITGIGD